MNAVWLGRWWIAAMAVLAGGCGAQLSPLNPPMAATNTTSSPSAPLSSPHPRGGDARPPVGAAAAQPPAPGDTASTAGAQHSIVGFAGPTVVLYNSANGNDGQRLPASSLTLPLAVRGGADGASRVEVETVGGPRWIARSDIRLAPAATQ